MKNSRAVIFALGCFLTPALSAYAGHGTEVVIGDDLTVLGTGGSMGDPDLNVKGSASFGSPHNAVSAVSISSSAISKTPAAPAAIAVGPGGNVLKVNSDGSVTKAVKRKPRQRRLLHKTGTPAAPAPRTTSGQAVPPVSSGHP